MLKKATLSEPWKNPKNQTRYALMIDGEIIGYYDPSITVLNRFWNSLPAYEQVMLLEKKGALWSPSSTSIE